MRKIKPREVYITPRWELGGRLAGCGATNADASAIYVLMLRMSLFELRFSG